MFVDIETATAIYSTPSSVRSASRFSFDTMLVEITMLITSTRVSCSERKPMEIFQKKQQLDPYMHMIRSKINKIRITLNKSPGFKGSTVIQLSKICLKFV